MTNKSKFGGAAQGLDANGRLPCPFCGCPASKDVSNTGTCWVTCDSCGMEGPLGHDEENAVAKWNTRTDIRQSPAAVAQCAPIREPLVYTAELSINGRYTWCIVKAYPRVETVIEEFGYGPESYRAAQDRLPAVQAAISRSPAEIDADARDVVSMLILCGELGGIGKDEKPNRYLRRLLDAFIDRGDQVEQSTDKVLAWDTVAGKNARIAKLRYAIIGYFEVFDRCGGSESVSPDLFAAARQQLREALSFTSTDRQEKKEG